MFGFVATQQLKTRQGSSPGFSALPALSRSAGSLIRKTKRAQALDITRLVLVHGGPGLQ